MPHWQMPWQVAAIAAGCLAIAAVAIRTARRRWTFTAAGARETALVLGLFALWQLAGNLSLGHESDAYARGNFLWHAERVLHLPSEGTVQHLVLPHPLLVQVLNGYYIYGHINSMVLFLIWLFVRHRDRYPHYRNLVVLFTGAALLVQLVPVAPPRLLNLGLVDTGLAYHQSVYGPMGPGLADQLSAMPSVHVGWAVLIAYVAVRVSPSRWRWLVVLHPALTVFAVVATANHFWLDGVGAVLLLAIVAVVQRLLAALPIPRPELIKPSPAG